MRQINKYLQLNQRMQQRCGVSFDLNNFSRISKQSQHDYVDRIKQEIRLLQMQNQELQSELRYIEENPQELISSFQQKFLKKIGQLREQNQGIEQLIEKSRVPGYVEMTKKKVSYAAQTPGKCQRYEDQLSDFGKRNLFDSVSEKMQASTCQNFPIQNNNDNPLRTLQPLQDQQLRARAHLTAQLLQVINRTSQISAQMQHLRQQNHTQSSHHIQANNRNIEYISKYKQRLLQLFKKLKTRQANQQQIVRQYQVMYEQTLKQFKQATQILNQLTSVKTEENLDDLYAEVLQLQQRLAYINQQLERVDETQWLKDILCQLHQALKRLGISAPDIKQTNNPTIDQLRQQIDSLAQILIQCCMSSRTDDKQRLALLKLYYEQQKQNNKKILKNLQNKEQGLSKKLIDLQMNN